jgi:hypothetical protein
MSSVSARQILTGLHARLPDPEPVEPLAFLEDELLPLALAPVEPVAFALACVQSLWGGCGPRN